LARGVSASTSWAGWRRGTSSERFREEVAPHVGTTDVDLVIGLALGDDSPETYRTLANNLKTSGFTAEMSFRWKRSVDGVAVTVEFLCETDEVEPGKIFRPRADAGSALVHSTCAARS